MTTPTRYAASQLQEAWLSAWHFASLAHAQHTLPSSDLPYLVHLAAVAMEILVAHQRLPFARPELAVQCAILHDALEDTNVSEAELEAKFGPDVLAGVQALTKDSAFAKPEAMADSLQRIRQQPPEIWAVKLADRITNMQTPPAHWDALKIEAYRDEAQGILDALGTAHASLAARLAEKIANYPPRHSD